MRLPFLTIWIVLTLLWAPTALAVDSALLKGKVTDPSGRGVNGAKIVVHDEEHNEYKSGRSDSNGEFEVEHTLCNNLSFEVTPPPKLGLAPAHYQHVTGGLSKHFIVKLHPGFKISGRITAAGRGLKGLPIRFVGLEAGSTSTVHGGASTVSRADGRFSVLLTPGKKRLEISNDEYSDLAPIYHHEITITGDTVIPDMILPVQK